MTTTHQPEAASPLPYTLSPLRSPHPGREPLLRALRLWQSPETEEQVSQRKSGGLCVFVNCVSTGLAASLLKSCFERNFPFNPDTRGLRGSYWNEVDAGNSHLNLLRIVFVTEAIATLEAELEATP